MRGWKNTFAVISSGQAASLLSSAVVQFSIIWWITFETGSASALSIATLAGFLPQGVLGPLAGTFVDRWNRKAVMIGADLALAVSSLGLALLFALGEPALWHIYAVLAIRSAGTAFHVPAMQASMPLFVPAEQLTRVAGFSQAIVSESVIAGPALGAAAVVVWPMWLVLLLDVAGALVAVVTLALVTIPQPPRPAAAAAEAPEPHLLRETAYGLKVLARTPGLLPLTLLISLVTFVYMPINALFPLMSTGHFRGGAWHVGAVEVAFGVGMLSGSILLGVWGGTRQKSHMVGGAISAMGLILLAMGLLPRDGWVWFAGLAACLGFAAPMFGGPFTALLQTKIEPAALGRVLSAVSSLALLATPLGLLLAGPAADRVGVPLWFAGSGVVIAALGMLPFVWRSIRHAEDSQAADVGSPTTASSEC